MRTIVITLVLIVIGPLTGRSLAQPADFGSGSESIITHLPEATGVHDGMAFALYHKRSSAGHTLVYGPLFGIARDPLGNPLVTTSQPGNIVEIACTLWPPESLVHAYQERLFASRPDLQTAPISRLELYDVTASISYVDPGDGGDIKGGVKELYRVTHDGAVSHQGDFVIRCALPAEALDEAGKVKRGAVEMRWTYYYRVRDRVVTNWLRMVSDAVLIDEVRKDLIPSENWQDAPSKRIAVFADQEGAFGGVFAKSLGVFFSPSLTPKQINTYIDQVRSLILEQESISMSLSQLMNDQVAIYYQGLRLGNRQDFDTLVERLASEVVADSVSQYDEILYKILSDDSSKNLSKLDFAERLYEIDRGRAGGGGGLGIGKFSLGGSGGKEWDRLTDNERTSLATQYEEIRNIFNSDSSTRRFFERSATREADGDIYRYVTESKQYSMKVFDLVSLAQSLQVGIGEEAFSDRSAQQSVVTTVGGVSPSETSLSPLDRFYAPPGTIIEYRGDPRDIDSSVLWRRCDGGPLPHDSPLYDLGIRQTPDRAGRVPRGAESGEAVGSTGGRNATGELTTALRGGAHSHTLQDHFHPLPGSTGLVATSGDAPRGPRPYLSRDNNGIWGSGQHIVVDAGGPAAEGDHRHELGGRTEPAGGGATREDGSHIHTVGSIDLRPSYEATVWIIRIR